MPPTTIKLHTCFFPTNKRNNNRIQCYLACPAYFFQHQIPSFLFAPAYQNYCHQKDINFLHKTYIFCTKYSMESGLRNNSFCQLYRYYCTRNTLLYPFSASVAFTTILFYYNLYIRFQLELPIYFSTISFLLHLLEMCFRFQRVR